MSERHEEPLSPEQRLAREAVERLPRPQADLAYRARLRSDFVSGAIAAGARAPARAPAFGRPRVAWLWAPAAAALLVVAGAWINRGPGWTVASAGSEGIAVVGGQPIPLTHREDLARAIRGGGSIRLEGASGLELIAPGQMAVEVTPSTEAVLPPTPGRWFGRALRAAVTTGEIRITTGRGFRGARLAVETPEVRVEVVGTTLAVICESVGTCVCVMDGHVMMGPKDGPMAPIEAGRRRFVFNDGRPVEEATMRPLEKVKLGQMEARHAAMR